MFAIVVVSGLLLGALAAWAWHRVIRLVDTRPLFSALGRSVKSLLSVEAGFLQEYGRLLICVGSFVGWNLVALAGAVAPLLLAWPFCDGHETSLVWAYSVSSIVSVVWLRANAKQGEALEALGGLGVSDSQFFFLQVAESTPWLMRKGRLFESRILRGKLASTQIDRPVFISGLARSGTTMLLELLAQADGVATHRYRDFPFLLTPYFWSRFCNVFGRNSDSVQRPHQDGIHITPESPEAFEEPIWQQFFPDAHRLVDSHILNGQDGNPGFDSCFVEHLKKILLIRDGKRYLSKGNYNVTRLEYLSRLFPDARFVVPIRHPISHVVSLVRQHELFCAYSLKDQRVPHYLRAVGHYEFGPQRVPISVDGMAKDIQAAWEGGDEYLGYALQWAAVYSFVSSLLKSSDDLAERVMVIRYEDLCASPESELQNVLTHADLGVEGSAVLNSLQHIKNIDRSVKNSIAEKVWDVTEAVAAEFGYQSAAGNEQAL